jgi:hypothetical protein
MYQNVPKCTKMYQNVPKCTKMYQNVPKCTSDCLQRCQGVHLCGAGNENRQKSAPYYNPSPGCRVRSAPAGRNSTRLNLYQIPIDRKYRFLYWLPTVDPIGCLRSRPRPARIGCTTDCPRSWPFGSRSYGSQP